MIYCGFLFCQIILAAVLNGFGSGIRVLSTIRHMTSTEKFAVVLFGQSLAAIAQTLLLPLPPKLAALWFGESQRVIANMISSTCKPALLHTSIYCVVIQ